MTALKEMSPHPLGAAVDNIPHRPPMTGRQGVAIPVAVLGTAGPEDIRYPGHGLKIGHKMIQGFGECIEALVRQMGVAGRCLRALMPHEFLNHPQGDAPFQ